MYKNHGLEDSFIVTKMLEGAGRGSKTSSETRNTSPHNFARALVNPSGIKESLFFRLQDSSF